MAKKFKKIRLKNPPTHIAFIVDGNRRWAKNKGLSLVAGHQKATDETIEKLIFHCLDLGIKYLAFWAFSTENWKRGKRFSSMLFKILENKINEGVEKYNSAGIKLKIIGDLSKLPKSLSKTLQKWEKDSRTNTKITVVIALNYGGRDEIIRAINKLPDKKIKAKDLEEQLDTIGIPDPDLIIRTGGAKRLSGFMSWQSAYSELYFTNALFPDFTPKKLDETLRDYEQRQRRFGK